VTVVPGDDDRPDRVETGGSTEPAGATGPVEPGDSRDRSWRSNPSDLDVDAAFADIVSGMITDSVRRHPSGGPPAVEVGPGPPADAAGGPADSGSAHPDVGRIPDNASERARRRELRRLERAAEVAAFAESEAQQQAERDADTEHFTPPDPPPLPRPRLRTIGSVLMIVGGILLLTRPGLLAVSPDLALILSVLLIVGGAVLLLTGIWRRRGGNGGDGWDDGAVV
jgi:hypothetical protein